MKTRLIVIACCLLAGLFLTGIAQAKKSYLNSVNSTCSVSHNCDLCHLDPKGGGPLNTDGQGFADSGYDPSYFCPGSECLDLDGDGFAIDGGTCGQIDCDDSNAAINPGAAEVCDDGFDNDCDGLADCDDNECGNALVCQEPSESEICDDGIDNDGDNKIDCADKRDCGKTAACTDDSGGGGSDTEVCDDGFDNDGDGKADCADKKDCRAHWYCQ